MRPNTVTLVPLLVLIAMTTTGCARIGHRRFAVATSAKYVIFNPEWTQLPPRPVARADWPTTTGFSGLEEIVEYQETIYDWQGRSSDSRDQSYYRRFESWRTGRGRR